MHEMVAGSCNLKDDVSSGRDRKIHSDSAEKINHTLTLSMYDPFHSCEKDTAQEVVKKRTRSDNFFMLLCLSAWA